MIVRCSNCQTQFSLDDRQLGPDGAAVRCTVCGYVFRLGPAPDASARPWHVRTVEGQVFSAPDLPTLRGWAGEGRLHPDDEISRTSKHWIRLGDMPEFADAFAGFADLPSVLTPLSEGAEFGATDLGPPPMFGAAAGGPDEGAVFEQLPDDGSQGIDVSGLLDRPLPMGGDDSETVAKAAPDVDAPTVVRRDPSASIPTDVGPSDVAQPRGRASKGPAHPAATRRRKPKTATAKIRMVTAEDEIASDESGVVRMLDDADMVEVDDEGSIPNDGRPPTSMLNAVTAHVQPGAAHGDSAPLAVDRVASAPLPVDPQRDVSTPDAEIPAAVVATPPPAKKRSLWPVIAGLGVLCGAAVVFGVPQIRERVLETAGRLVGHQPPDAETLPQVVAVAEAIQTADPRALEAARKAAEASATDADANSAVRLQLAAVEAEATRSVALSLLFAADPSNNDAKFSASDAAEHAGQTFAGIDVSRADAATVTRVRARLRLAQGRPVDEVLALVPDTEPELGWLAKARPVWQAAEPRVPDGVVVGLSSLERPTTLAQIVLALAHWRNGDSDGAVALLDTLAETQPEHPVALALRATFDEPAQTPDEASDPVPDVPPADAGGDVASPDVGTAQVAPEDDDEPTMVPSGDTPRVGVSVDKLITRGCEKVDRGNAKEGLKILLRAFDRRPSDIDVLVCMAEAHRKLGTHGSALRYYEKALSRNPKYRPALLGAARSATKSGAKDRALTFYRRLIAIAPSNAEAKAYIAKREAEKKSGDTKSPPPAKADPPPAKADPPPPAKPTPTPPAVPEPPG